MIISEHFYTYQERSERKRQIERGRERKTERKKEKERQGDLEQKTN